MLGLPWVGLELLGGVSFWRKPWPHGVPVRRAIAFFVIISGLTGCAAEGEMPRVFSRVACHA